MLSDVLLCSSNYFRKKITYELQLFKILGYSQFLLLSLEIFTIFIISFKLAVFKAYFSLMKI